MGGLLLIDVLGQPLEFTHASLEPPSGFLWNEGDVRRVATERIAHSLFDACKGSPTLLLAKSDIGTPTFCQEHLAPSVPFVLVSQGIADDEISMAPVGAAPAGAALAFLNELKRRRLFLEPFGRLRRALEEVYGVEQDGRP